MKTEPTDPMLFWRPRGWPPLVLIGALAATIAVSLSLQKGYHDGFDAGIQRLETGQAQLESIHGSIDSFFMVKALTQQIPGVEATSARWDFFAQLTNPKGVKRSVHVRACNFDQEDQVTGILHRTTPVGKYLTAGLVLSPELASDPEWSSITTVGIARESAPGYTPSVPVTGRVVVSAGASLDRIVYLDLDYARRLFGVQSVSAIAIELHPGLEPARWVQANQEAFQKYDLLLRSWSELPDKYYAKPEVPLGGLDFLLNGWVWISLVGIVLTAFQSKSPRSGLSVLFRSGRRGKWQVLALLCASFAVTAGFSFLVLNLFQDWLIRGLHEEFPFVGPPRLLWGWDAWVLWLPVLSVGVGLVAYLLPQSRTILNALRPKH